MRPQPQKYKRASSALPPRRTDPSMPLEPVPSTDTITEDTNTNDSGPHHNTSPLARLPAELLAHIFEQCLSKDTFLAPEASQAPLLIAHTCSYWRAVALSTPLLWSRLHITYKDPSLDVPIASDWLQRSGSLPLFISISIDFNEHPAQEILDVICAHSLRWQHIRFEFRGLYCPPMYSLSLAQANTPLLHAFEFDARDISSANITPIISLLNSAPQLREVTWVDDLADTRRLMELPLSRLTLLSITMSHGTLDYLELLDQCYNLEHIRITRPRPGETRPSREPLLLSKLTSLNIAHDLTAILDSLVLPALKHVRIHSEGQSGQRSTGRSMGNGAAVGETEGGGGSGTWSPVSFLSLIERSACTIESLWLDAPMTESCLARCLEISSSTLSKLTVAGVVITDKLLSYLTRPLPSSSSLTSPETTTTTSAVLIDDTHTSVNDGSSFSCPRLQEMNLNTRISSTPGALSRMVTSRLIPQNNHPHHPVEGGEPARHVGSFLLRIWDGHKDLETLESLREQQLCSPLGSCCCQFKLGVLTPPRDIFCSNSGFPTRPRARRYLSAKRRTCQSR